MAKKVLYVLVACAALFLGMIALRPLVLPFVLGAFLSYVLEPPVAWLSRRMNRSRAILLTYVVIALLLGLTGAYFVPNFLRDVRELALAIPKYAAFTSDLSRRLSEAARKYGLSAEMERFVLERTEEMRKGITALAGKLVTDIVASAETVAKLFLAPVVAYYLLKDLNSWRQEAFVHLSKLPDPFLELFHDVDTVIGGFVRGQAVVAAAVMIMVWAAAAILRLNYGAVLGVIAGLGEFIPYFGPIVAAVPMLVVGFAKSPGTGLKTLAAVLIIQQIDASVIVPRVTGRKVGLHPLAVIAALLVGGHYFGFWGFFLAVPALGILRALAAFALKMLRKRQ